MKFEPRAPTTWYQTLVVTEVADKTSASWAELEVARKAKTSFERPPGRSFDNSKPSKLPRREFCLKTMYCCPVEIVLPGVVNKLKRTQQTTVKLVGLSVAESGIAT